MTNSTGRMRRRLRAGAAVITGVAVFGIAGPPAAQPAEAGRPADSSLPARYTKQRPVWKPCSAGMPAQECATITVPLDYRRPNGTTITMAISRIMTSTPARRRGVLLFNPGGPGDEGLTWPAFMRSKLPKEVTDQYDLIGFDPRGIGASSAVACREPVAPVPAPENFAAEVAAAREYATTCARSSPAMGHLTTRNTARDMDLLRAVLGEERISYFGVSYGTYLGAVYTQLFGKRADRIVLDSAVDPALVWRREIQMDAAAAEAAFQRWTRWAAERDATYHLGAEPDVVRATFWRLVARADVDPIEADGTVWTGADIRSSAVDVMVFVERATEWVVALRAAAAGPARRHADGGEPESDPAPAGGMAVVCNDARWPRDPETYRRDALRDRKRYPLAGYESSTIMPCAFWTNPHAEPPTTVHNDVQALIVHNEWDPNTAVPMAFGLRRAMRAARLIMVDEGEGHVVYGKGNVCADDAVNTYLSTGELPERDKICDARKSVLPPPARGS